MGKPAVDHLGALPLPRNQGPSLRYAMSSDEWADLLQGSPSLVTRLQEALLLS